MLAEESFGAEMAASIRLGGLECEGQNGAPELHERCSACHPWTRSRLAARRRSLSGHHGMEEVRVRVP
jgi:hypothetical protein